ncbi:MAG: membrane protein insertase YidC [Firmicutes bacterium]|nr:membrane protein insertase YidC [Bacillota bacterium]
MAFLNLINTAYSSPTGLWSWLILNVFGFMENYGWRVILFTVLLKLLLSPLDIYQRIAMKKNQRITERIKPEVEKLKKQYANNPRALQAKQRELNKREGYKMAAGCLPMIVTLVVSIWLLTELTGISQYRNMMNYVRLYEEYTAAELSSFSREVTDTGVKGYILLDAGGKEVDDPANAVTVKLNHAAFGLPDNLDDEPESFWTEEKNDLLDQMNAFEAAALLQAKQAGQAAVDKEYPETQESFLWVKNIWVADVPWTRSVMDEDAFRNAVGKYGRDGRNGATGALGVAPAELDRMMSYYPVVTEKLYADENVNTRNGYLVLPILSILVMVVSQMLTRRMQKNSGMAAGGPMGGMAGGKMMAYMMPVMFGIFSLFYTTAFSLYMIMNSLVMIAVSLGAAGVIKLLDKREAKETESEEEEGVLRIGRPDPNAPKEAKAPKNTDNNAKNKKR